MLAAAAVGGNNMDLDMLRIIFLLMAMAGGITCGIVLAKSNSFTRWRSKLGVCAIIGVILLIAGLGGSLIIVKHRAPTAVSRIHYGPAGMVYAYTWGIKPNGHGGYGMNWVLR